MNTVASEPSLERDLLCPLCEYNLRGLSEPRCPECGHRFDWEELRDPNRQHAFLFEHPRRGIRSFFATLFHSLLPRRFWKSIRTTHQPAPKRLFVYWLMMLLLSACMLTVTLAASMGREYQDKYQMRQQIVARLKLMSPQQIRAITPATGSPQSIAATILPYPMPWRAAEHVFEKEVPLQTTLAAALGMIVLWPPMTFATLMLYRRVLRQAQLRTPHVMRVVIYSADALLCLGPMLSLIWIEPQTWYPYSYNFTGFMPTLTLIIFAGMSVLLAYRVVLACRLYLRVPLVAGAILTQILVTLALLKLYQFFIMAF